MEQTSHVHRAFKALKYNKDHCIAHREYNIKRELEDCIGRLKRVYKNRHFKITTHFWGNYCVQSCKTGFSS